MRRKNYEFLEHTADIAVKVKAKTLKSLFINAAAAVFSVIAEKISRKRSKKEKIIINKNSANIETLLVEWLNELLYFSATKGLIFTDFKIDFIGENTIKAAVYGEETTAFKINTEVKAATYHELEVKRHHSGWQAKFILDV